MRWSLESFNELSKADLYAILKLRQEVFVVEQNCPYVDADGKDFAAWHLLGWQQDQLVAYLRILPPNVSYPNDSSIGRVITSEAIRGQRFGAVLMQGGITACKRLFPDNNIRISAQSHLVKFYSSLGFISTGKEYLEDDIPHTEMVLEMKSE